MIESIVKKSIVNPDDYIFGFANLKGLVENSLLNFGVIIGKKLDSKIIDAIVEGPTLEYFNYYEKINEELSVLIHKVAKQLVEFGFSSEVIEPTMNDSEIEDKNYKNTLQAPISHKMIATRAGLGWIGKTDLFISKKFGPRLRLVSLLTNYPAPISEQPLDKSRCGKCDKCVMNCPANAATGELWDIYTSRDRFFNAHKCRDKCKELTKKNLNMDLAICGICVSVCPIGKVN